MMSSSDRAGARLPAGIDVWRVATLAFSSAAGAWHWKLLDEAECRRAQRMLRADDRLRFEVGRASLQMLLQRYLGREGRRTVIEADESGKLRLARAGETLNFNSSHSGNWVLHAFADSVGVGVDVEKVDERIARGFDDYLGALAPEEREALEQHPAPSRPFQFLRCWVRKEAYLKAIGAGLRRSPELVCIGPAADGRVRLRYDRNAAEPAGHWNFVDLAIDDRHLGCVAYPGPERSVHVRDDGEWLAACSGAPIRRG